MRLISWNVNGLRACLKKDFLASFAALDADMFCLQETKLQPDQVDFSLPGYHMLFHSAEKKGYSSTAIFTRTEPLSVAYDFPGENHPREGRVITAEFPDFYLVCCYTPNSQDGLRRLDYRLQWEADFRAHLQTLDAQKPVILCGDLNVAHEEIDLKNPNTNHKNPGFTDQERGAFTALLEAGFADSFRALHPDARDAYSWWSYRAGARERNVGWRIDYFVVSQRLLPRVQEAVIYPHIHGSDHCPVGIVLGD